MRKLGSPDDFANERERLMVIGALARLPWQSAGVWGRGRPLSSGSRIPSGPGAARSSTDGLKLSTDQAPGGLRFGQGALSVKHWPGVERFVHCCLRLFRATRKRYTAGTEPKRRAILSLLALSQLSDGEIERQLRMPQPSVSKHLRVQREGRFRGIHLGRTVPSVCCGY